MNNNTEYPEKYVQQFCAVTSIPYLKLSSYRADIEQNTACKSTIEHSVNNVALPL